MSSDNDDNSWVFKVKEPKGEKKKSSSSSCSSSKSKRSGKVKTRVKDKTRVETFKEKDIIKQFTEDSNKTQVVLEDAMVGRKARATYHDEHFQAKEYETPELSQRLISIAVDVGILIFLFGISNFERMIILSEDLYFTIINPLGMAELLSNEQLDIVLPGINFLILGFVFHILPSVFLRKSIGKMVMKIKVYSEETFVPTKGKMFYREAIFKPLSLITIFGFAKIFFSEDAQGLHDSICHTIVVKDK